MDTINWNINKSIRMYVLQTFVLSNGKYCFVAPNDESITMTVHIMAVIIKRVFGAAGYLTHFLEFVFGGIKYI